MQPINDKNIINLSYDELFKEAQKYELSYHFFYALNLYNLLETRVNQPGDECLLKYLRGKCLQKLQMNDEAIELYKRFVFDYENELGDYEKIDLPDTYTDCLFNMSEIYIESKQNFLAVETLQKSLKLVDDTSMKCRILLKLMYVFNAESDFQSLKKVIEDYDELNTYYMKSAVNNYRQILENNSAQKETKIIFQKVPYLEDYYNFESFVPVNHYCVGGSISICDFKYDDYFKNKTVIYIAAQDDNNYYAVGWYEYAGIFKHSKTDVKHKFKANEQNVYIIPAGERKLIEDVNKFDEDKILTEYERKLIEDANKFDKDKILNYLDEIRSKCQQHFITYDQINECAYINVPITDKQLIENAQTLADDKKYLDALRIYNLLNARVDSPQKTCALSYLRGNILNQLNLYDEAVELYKECNIYFENVLFDDKMMAECDEKIFSDMKQSAQVFNKFNLPELNLQCMYNLALVYKNINQNLSAIKYLNKCFEQANDINFKVYVLNNLMQIYHLEGDEKLLDTIKLYNEIKEKADIHVVKIMDSSINFYQKTFKFKIKFLIK